MASRQGPQTWKFIKRVTHALRQPWTQIHPLMLTFKNLDSPVVDFKFCTSSSNRICISLCGPDCWKTWQRSMQIFFVPAYAQNKKKYRLRTKVIEPPVWKTTSCQNGNSKSMMFESTTWFPILLNSFGSLWTFPHGATSFCDTPAAVAAAKANLATTCWKRGRGGITSASIQLTHIYIYLTIDTYSISYLIKNNHTHMYSYIRLIIYITVTIWLYFIGLFTVNYQYPVNLGIHPFFSSHFHLGNMPFPQLWITRH